MRNATMQLQLVWMLRLCQASCTHHMSTREALIPNSFSVVLAELFRKSNKEDRNKLRKGQHRILGPVLVASLELLSGMSDKRCVCNQRMSKREASLPSIFHFCLVLLCRTSDKEEKDISRM